MSDSIEQILRDDCEHGLAVIPKTCLASGKLVIELDDLFHVVLCDDPPTQGHAQTLGEQLRKTPKKLPIPIDDCVIIPLDKDLVNLLKANK